MKRPLRKVSRVSIIQNRRYETEVVAKKIHALIDSDMFYIDTVQKYPDDHMKKIEMAKQEYNEAARPELTARVENMAEYDKGGIDRRRVYAARERAEQP